MKTFKQLREEIQLDEISLGTRMNYAAKASQQQKDLLRKANDPTVNTKLDNNYLLMKTDKDNAVSKLNPQDQFTYNKREKGLTKAIYGSQVYKNQEKEKQARDNMSPEDKANIERKARGYGS